jgi:hypothetical protein
MHQYSLRSLTLLLALTGACGDNTTSTPPATDMATSASDLSMTVVTDMATTPVDMTYVPPKLTFSNCTPQTVTAATIYSTIVATSCAGPGCHSGNGANAAPLMGQSGAALIAAVVGKASFNGMNYVTASDVDNSYFLYKVFNQQQKVRGGGGSQMPSSAPLSDTNMCALVNWVRSGAK